MSKIIGIDLGTTNSCVAVMEGGKPRVINSAEGRNVIPSVVEPNKNLVGDVAKRQMILNPEGTVSSVKRLMGRRFTDDEVKKTMKMVAYKIENGKGGMAVINIGGKIFTPQEISAKVLQKCKADAEAYLGEKVESAVITVPAYFDDAQRQATKQAGEISGLKVERIINEPTAAALAYGLDKKNGETIAVYDLGGGTFDISVLEIGDGVFEVKATNGDTHLGGDDFDERVVNWIADEFKKDQGVDLRLDKQALQRVRDAAEKAKIELSSAQETEISQPYITQGPGSQPLHLTMKLTRAKLEQLVGDLIEKTIKPVEACLKDAKITAKDLNEIVMVGGMTRMPKVFETIKSFFGKEPNRSVNPDEVVAVGASIQGGVLGGEVKDILLLDVTPLTLGVETLGGVRTPIIDRNTTVPTSKSQIFSTAADNQTQVEINVLQGERPMAVDNKSLGRFVLAGIPPAPRGIPQVEVAFDIDASGILKVSAKDKATNKEQSVIIKGAVGLTDEEIKAARAEAEKYAADDQKKKESVEARNQADALVFTAEKTLKEAGDKASADLKAKVEAEIKNVKDFLAKEDATKDQLEEASKKLSEVLQAVGAAMYGSAGPSAASSGSSDSPQGQSQQTPPQGQGVADGGGKASSSAKATEDKSAGDVEEGEVVE